MNRFLVLIFLVIFFLEFSFFPMVFPEIFPGVGLLIAFLIVLFFQFGFKKTLPWAIVVALVMDYFSATGWGIYVFSIGILLGLLELYRGRLLSAKPSGPLKWLSFFIFFFVFQALVLLWVKIYSLLGADEVASFQGLDWIFWSGLFFVLFCGLLDVLIGKADVFWGAQSNELKIERPKI